MKLLRVSQLREVSFLDDSENMAGLVAQDASFATVSGRLILSREKSEVGLGAAFAMHFAKAAEYGGRHNPISHRDDE